MGCASSSYLPLDPPRSTVQFLRNRISPRNRIGYHDFFVIYPILWRFQTAILKELYLSKDSSCLVFTSGILRLVCSSVSANVTSKV